MKRQQSGFTLVEIAIVLVIIGLLLGGILKGQELINSAKVKNLANDFRVIPTYIYAYQDKYKALPGDDAQVAAHLTLSGAGTLVPGNGNGVIDGTLFATTGETYQFWQHVRLANLAAGPTDNTVVAGSTYIPTNAVGGQLAVSSMSGAQPFITGMTGTYQVCSRGILGKFAKQLDIQMDDGVTNTGSLQVVVDGVSGAPLGNAAVDDATPYTVCVTF
jgi:prepilin-type N-terminal cleavage/methylation domain-containing protein